MAGGKARETGREEEEEGEGEGEEEEGEGEEGRRRGQLPHAVRVDRKGTQREAAVLPNR